MVTLRKDEWNTLSGLNLPLESTPESVSESGVDLQSIGNAGSPPYTRGIHSTMYRSRLWTMRQYAGFSSAAATNERFKLLLERGQKGLSVAFDLPTQLGLDADDEMSYGEVGKVGDCFCCAEVGVATEVPEGPPCFFIRSIASFCFLANSVIPVLACGWFGAGRGGAARRSTVLRSVWRLLRWAEAFGANGLNGSSLFFLPLRSLMCKAPNSMPLVTV
ncbi:methylmalonyl-CoA mutase family protein [Candidatus Poseidoniales archaeon]|nr:methylmalonyl-CoA mutase family protein [Candidatus Poseidoniales archaeon]